MQCFILHLFIIVYDMSSLGTYKFLGYPWLRTHPICNFAHVPKLCSRKALLSITGLPRGKIGEKTAVGRVCLWCLFTFMVSVFQLPLQSLFSVIFSTLSKCSSFTGIEHKAWLWPTLDKTTI